MLDTHSLFQQTSPPSSPNQAKGGEITDRHSPGAGSGIQGRVPGGWKKELVSCSIKQKEFVKQKL